MKEKNIERIDCTIPRELKIKLINKSKELGLNLKSTLIVILNDYFK